MEHKFSVYICDLFVLFFLLIKKFRKEFIYTPERLQETHKLDKERNFTDTEIRKLKTYFTKGNEMTIQRLCTILNNSKRIQLFMKLARNSKFMKEVSQPQLYISDDFMYCESNLSLSLTFFN